VKIFNLKKLSDLQVMELCMIEILNRFAALGNLNDRDDINRAWENITENLKTSGNDSLELYELMQHIPWFD